MRSIAILADSTIRGRCPSCREVSMFRGYYDLHDACPNCGVRFNASEGAWIGAVAFGYGIGALAVVVLGLAEFAFHPFESLGLHPLWSVAVVAIVITALGYRLAKGAWFGLLYLYGFVVPDGTSEGADWPVDRPRASAGTRDPRRKDDR